MSKILTRETRETLEAVIAVCALALSVIAFWRGERARKRQDEINRELRHIERTRFQREEAAAQAAADFNLSGTRVLMPVGPSQQPHGPSQPPPPPLQHQHTLQYQYTFQVHNVGKATARDLSIEVQTTDLRILYRSGAFDFLPAGHAISVPVILGDFPQLRLAIKWKDNVNREGEYTISDPLVFVQRSRRWQAAAMPPLPWQETPMPPSGPTGEAGPH
jgi:hypothetical protein